MPKGVPSLNESQRSEIIKRITDKGERVPDLAREYNVATKIIPFPIKKVKLSKIFLREKSLKNGRPDNPYALSLFEDLVFFLGQKDEA